MDERIQKEIEDYAKGLFGDAVRRVERVQHGGEAVAGAEGGVRRVVLEPDEVLLRLVLAVPPGHREGRFRAGEALKAFRDAHGQPKIRKFQHDLAQLLPEVRALEVAFEDAGRRPHPGMMIALGDDDKQADNGVTNVMVRLKPAELDIVDTLIAVGVATNRAEALRWTLGRISERPAFARLRERSREIEKLRDEL